MRFALVCAGAVLVLGGLALTAVHVVVAQSLEYRGSVFTPAAFNDDWRTFHRYEDMYEVARTRAMQVHAVYQRDTLNNVRLTGVAAVLAATAAAFGLGWRCAGWLLRPLRQVTETARRVAQSHDLTERIAYDGPREEIKELADTYDTMLGRLARAFGGQRKFVANAAHELRTPLTINRTLVDVAVRRPDATDDVKRLGESLLLVNTRHERLIDGLLALAEGEQAVLDRRPFDLTDVAEHVLDQAAAEAAEREVTIHRLLDPAPTAGEAVLVERLVQNLVENAVRHNHPKGEVWVTTRGRADRVELVVANTGLQVPTYEIETIFEPFRRLHADRLRSDRGSGLGLSIVRVIAQAHDGTVVARPREEGGLTITVELPADPAGS
ncbi:sensor histidine kinase [Nonomuraea gerenzanensis]|uniref:histidine kinase n=1 Tax=Nonomuraea gerenzanensis TaxID=93944 RepID=A0A1M4E9D3_9ACTN|nr:HAMP domain-containing sensor histidine kinase [Nonomuraea gerenzanensis]UBU17685.1 HAMP domain-containing histidine kinase [Nonomuraea gerenzanensis]SBO95455.1 ATP-binding region, ATPase-like:Histidine kinase, HAMP region:Histidine kinase A, N-terminal [Nonomuraea gerenzanensis]